MTIPSDIAGLSERLRDRASTRNTGRFVAAEDCGTMGYYSAGSATLDREAAIALDSLSARVKELEAEGDAIADRCQQVYSQGLHEANQRVRRAEQQRDEAYERLKPFADAADSLDEDHLDRMDIWENPSAMEITAKHLRAARDLVRRLASGPEGGSVKMEGK